MAVPIEYKLDNGLKVIFEYVPGVKVVSVQSWIQTGSVNETPEISGISHFLEHILFKGTTKFKPGEIDTYLDSKGAYNNAFTSFDVTNYYVTIPTDEAEAAFEVVSQMVFEALLLADEIEKEKPVVLQEIKRSYDDPNYNLWLDVQQNLLGGTPYERKIIGTPETVSSFTRETLLDYYNKYYHPENMTLVIVGDIEDSKVRELATQYFSYKRDVEVGKMYDGTNKNTFTKPVTSEFSADIATEYVFVGYPTGTQTTEEMYADSVMMEILSGGEYSILNERLKLDNNIVISVNDVGMFNKYHGFFGIVAEVATGNADKFKAETKNILSDMINGNIDAKRIEKAKNRLKSKELFQAQDVSSLANEIGFSYVLGFKDYYQNYQQGITDVSLEDIKSSAKRLTSTPEYNGKTIPKS